MTIKQVQINRNDHKVFNREEELKELKRIQQSAFESKKEKFIDRRIWKNYGTCFSILSAIARGRNTATPGEKNVGDYLKQYLVRHGLQIFYELSTPSPVFRAQYNIIVGFLPGLSG